MHRLIKDSTNKKTLQHYSDARLGADVGLGKSVVELRHPEENT